MPTNILLVTKGHPFDYNGFYAMFDENPELNTTQVEQPAAQVMLRPENVASYDVVVFYDMWGIPLPGTGDLTPPADYVKSIEALLESGTGIVMMNHAMVQWPEWPLWREISGSTFLLMESELNGKTVPGSGFRGGAGEPERNATHFLSVVDPSHPVMLGLGDGFEITDEVYLMTAEFEGRDDIVPLMRSDYDFVKENFTAPPLASAEEQASWDHSPGTNLITWAKRSGNSPVIATSAGDGPPAYANPDFRQFLENAIKWVASDEAKDWAKG